MLFYSFFVDCLITMWFNRTEWVACNRSSAEPWLGSLCHSSSRATHYAFQEAFELSAAARQSGTTKHACEMILKIWKRNTTIYIVFFNVCLGTWILCDLTVVLFSSVENDYPFLFRMFLQSPCFLMFVGVLLVYSVCLVDYNSLLITLLVSWRIHLKLKICPIWSWKFAWKLVFLWVKFKSIMI
jgi:hypothetical protein